MENNEIVQPSEKAQKIPVIGFGRRLAATFIDGLILLTATFVLAMLIGLIGVYANLYTKSQPIPAHGLVMVCGLILSILYYVYGWSKSGQTIAKNVFGIKVIGTNGQPISIGRALLRYLGYIVSGLALSFGFLWVAFDKKHQGWHDKIASTYVVEAGFDIYSGQRFEFVATGKQPSRLWLAVWLLVAMVAPSVLLSSLFIMGPTLGRIVTEFLTGLF